MSRKKSTAAHVANGTYRPSVHGSRIDPLPSQTPAKPRGLAPKLSRLWDEFVRLLKDRLRPEDGPLVRMAVEWFATWQNATGKLGSETIGTLAYSRTLSAVSVASQRFEAIAKRLGMGPVDRESLSLPDPNRTGARRW